LEHIPDEKIEFQVIDIDQELEKIVLEGKKFLNQRFLYPLPEEEHNEPMLDTTLDVILRSKLRMYQGAIVID
jgi:hypothetical protein